MSKWKRVRIDKFLKARDERIKWSDATKLDLKRLEKIDFSGNLCVVEPKATKTDMIFVKPKDLVISGINVQKGALGIYEGKEDVLATIHYSSYEYDLKQIDLSYFKIFLQSSEFTNLLIQASKGGIKTELKPKHLLNLEIPLPSLEEQHQIVKKYQAFKTEYDQLTQEIKLQEESIKNLKKAILQDAVKGKLVPQDPSDESASELLKKIKAEKEKLIKEGKIKKDKPLAPIKPDEIPFEIPEGWVWCRLGEVLLKLTDGTHHSPPNLENGDYMYVTAKNIKDYGIDVSNITYVTRKIHDDIYSRCNPEYGDILYIKDGATTGIATLNNFLEPFSLLSSVALLKPFKDALSNSYLLLVLRSPYFYNTMRDDMTGVAITRVTLTKMNRTIAPISPLNEQKRIVAKVDELMKTCDEMEKEIKDSKRNAEIMYKAFMKELFEEDISYRLNHRHQRCFI